MGDESELICNLNTNKFFTINNQSKSPPVYRKLISLKEAHSQEDTSKTESLLDFGYMKEFDR